MKKFVTLLFLLVSVAAATAQSASEATAYSHAHNTEALQIIQHFLDSKIDSASYAEASAYIFQWAAPSHDINVMIDENIGEMQETPAGRYYVFAYIAATCEVQLQDKALTLTWPRFIRIMKRLNAFYLNNRAYTGQVKRLERYSLLSEADFEAALRKDFFELIPSESKK